MRSQPLDHIRYLSEPETELGISLPGGNRCVRVTGDLRGDPDQHLRSDTQFGCDTFELVEVVE